ncbi:hypothetical protein Q73_02080 [Bacillus coahuilensis m2-6]|uniref:hypothetical protein n=2 Tax=Bacillus coahuilensis TaxID=408580 RepID=UPI0007502F49|nr:hypothetical protein [Bacillus coahuilensis]KUP09689.1 hypothetical protein Q73_02080 [Bacillus coahuilensis m2-6]
MAKSKARKQREKLIREGRQDPVDNRSPFSQLNLCTKKTKTKKDVVYSRRRTNLESDHPSSSFYFCKIFL